MHNLMIWYYLMNFGLQKLKKESNACANFEAETKLICDKQLRAGARLRN